MIQAGLFDERNLFELGYPDYPNERLVVLLSTIVRNECLVSAESPDRQTFEATTTPSSKQQQALDLLATIAT